MTYTGVQYDGPIALRYPRNEIGAKLSKEFSRVLIGKSEILKRGADVFLSFLNLLFKLHFLFAQCLRFMGFLQP